MWCLFYSYSLLLSTVLKNKVTHVFIITADWLCSAVPLIRFLGLFSQLIFESFGESSYSNASFTGENRKFCTKQEFTHSHTFAGVLFEVLLLVDLSVVFLEVASASLQSYSRCRKPVLLKTCMSRREQKSWSWILTRSEARNDCAGNGQHKFNGPTVVTQLLPWVSCETVASR
jgi:hypothetical protein